jgi:hypothetical protein
LLWRNIKLLDAHFTQYDTVLRQQIRQVCAFSAPSKECRRNLTRHVYRKREG